MSLVIAVIVAWLWLSPPWNVLVVAGALFFELFEIWIFLSIRKKKTITGPEAMTGTRGEAVTECRPEGQARIRGQLWRVTCSEGVAAGEPVVVTAVHGTRLDVAPAPAAERGSSGAPRG